MTDDLDRLIHSYARGGDERQGALQLLIVRFEAMFRQRATLLLGSSKRVQQEADDVLQDVYIRLHRATFSVPFGANPVKSWILFANALIPNAVVDHCRKHFRYERQYWIPMTGVELLREHGMPDAFAKALEGIADQRFYSQKAILKVLDDQGTCEERKYWEDLTITQLRTDQRREVPIDRASDAGTPTDSAIIGFEIQQIIEQLNDVEWTICRLRHYEQMTFPEIAVVLSMRQARVQSTYYRAIDRARRDPNSG